MVNVGTLFKIKERLKKQNNLNDYDINTINNINNYLNSINYSAIDNFNLTELHFKEIKLDDIFSDSQLNDLFLSLNNNDYLKRFCIIFHLLELNCFKVPKKVIENIFNNCFKDRDYIYSYNIDFHYNCIHIDKKISFEQLIKINKFFQKYNILISYDFSKYELIITFENCIISESKDNVNFSFSLLPNKYMRTY